MLNWALMKNPLNWLTVGAMLLIFAVGFHLFSQYFQSAVPKP